MTQPARVPTGGLVDRQQPRQFTFDGHAYQGYAGDTLASALVANGVRLVGRSFKYHRPRGLLSAGPEEPNALVELRSGARREPNSRATVIELFDGLEARSQNRWPSLRFDVLAMNRYFSSVFVAGFYYKTFMWPAAFWEKVYEPMIRRAAGLGRAARQTDPDHYEKSWAHCDVLVIGGGPAGLSAALTAARTGARVVLADEDFVFGGRCLAERRTIGGQPVVGLGCRSGGRIARDAGGAAPATHDGVRQLRRWRVWRRRARQRSRCCSAAIRASAAALAHRREADGSCGGSDRAPTGLRQQRPAGRHAGRCRAHVPESVCSCARSQRRRFYRQRRWLDYRGRHRRERWQGCSRRRSARPRDRHATRAAPCAGRSR